MDMTGRGKQRIVTLTETAADLFLEMGYDAVSVDALISQAGGSRRNIYDRFGGKEGLFIEAITGICNEISAPLKDIVLDDTDPHSALVAFGEQVLALVLQPRTLALHRLMIAEGARFSGVAQAIWKSGPENAIKILNLWIVRQQSRGVLCSDSPSMDLAAHFIHALVSGPQLQALAGIMPVPPDPAALSRLTRISVTNFLQGCLLKESNSNA